MRTARSIWPLKTAWNLHNATGYNVRTCEYWLAGRAPILSDALAHLIRSQWGQQFVAAVMIGARPRWWARVLSYFAALDAMAMQRQARRRLKEALDADENLSASIARADAALVHDEDFYRPHADALRSMAGPFAGAMASPAGKGRRR